MARSHFLLTFPTSPPYRRSLLNNPLPRGTKVMHIASLCPMLIVQMSQVYAPAGV
jgi:hypothetical protein